MLFQIVEILDSRSQGILARVSHQNNQVTALIANQQTGDMLAGRSLKAEIGYDEILSWKVIPDFDDAQSGIWQEQDDVHFLGRIHSLLDFGDGKTIVEVYFPNALQTFTLDSEMIENESLESNNGLEVVVGKLYLYPNE